MLRRKLLLMDANVLIDFCDADATIISPFRFVPAVSDAKP